MRIRQFGIVTGFIGILGIIVADYLQPYASPILYVGGAILIGFALKSIEERFEIRIPRYHQLGFGDSRYAFQFAGIAVREEWESIFGAWAYVFTALYLVCKFLFWISYLGWFFLR